MPSISFQNPHPASSRFYARGGFWVTLVALGGEFALGWRATTSVEVLAAVVAASLTAGAYIVVTGIKGT